VNSNNVVVFPRNFNIPSLDDIQTKIKDSKLEIVETATGQICEELFMMIEGLGFNVGQKKCFKDTIFLVEAVKSLLYHSINEEHPFQKISQDIITIPDDYHDEFSDKPCDTE